MPSKPHDDPQHVAEGWFGTGGGTGGVRGGKRWGLMHGHVLQWTINPFGFGDVLFSFFWPCNFSLKRCHKRSRFPNKSKPLGSMALICYVYICIYLHPNKSTININHLYYYFSFFFAMPFIYIWWIRDTCGTFLRLVWKTGHSMKLTPKKIMHYYPYHPCMVYLPTFGWFLW